MLKLTESDSQFSTRVILPSIAWITKTVEVDGREKEQAQTQTQVHQGW